MEFDLFTLLPLAVAVFVFWKLRSVLGTRNGAERPPYDPYVGNDDAKNRADTNDNVVTLPNARGRQDDDAGEQAVSRLDEIAGDNENLARGLKAVANRDSSFDADQFVDGARMAYEMIVTGFADGDKRALKNLLSREVFENFEAVIDERAERGEKVNASFVGIETAEIAGAELVKDEAQVTIRFVSQMISATLDKDDEVIEGDLQEVAEITDVWTFARSVKSRDPNWRLVATDA